MSSNSRWFLDSKHSSSFKEEHEICVLQYNYCFYALVPFYLCNSLAQNPFKKFIGGAELQMSIGQTKTHTRVCRPVYTGKSSLLQ